MKLGLHVLILIRKIYDYKDIKKKVIFNELLTKYMLDMFLLRIFSVNHVNIRSSSCALPLVRYSLLYAI